MKLKLISSLFLILFLIPLLVQSQASLNIEVDTNSIGPSDPFYFDLVIENESLKLYSIS